MYIRLRVEVRGNYLEITFWLINIKYENTLASAGVFFRLSSG